MMQLVEGLELAAQLIQLLSPTCNEIKIGGSIRRLKPEVKDVELICNPRIVERLDVSGLTPVRRDWNRLDETIKALYRNNPILDRNRPRKNNASPPFGPRTYLIRYDGQPVDIFSIMQPADWFTQVVIRTGSAEFNKWLVTTCKARANVCFVDGHIEENSEGMEKRKIITPSREPDVFNICGIEYIEPEHRGENFMEFVKEL